MPSRGLHGPSKKKAGRAMSAAQAAKVADLAGKIANRQLTEPVYDLAYLAKVGHDIVKLLEKLIARLEPPPETDRLGREFMSGTFHRRSGDIYESVAEPGTPNAGDIGADNADNPSRPVRSIVERGD